LRRSSRSCSRAWTRTWSDATRTVLREERGERTADEGNRSRSRERSLNEGFARKDLVLPNAARLWGTLNEDARVLWLGGVGHFPWLEDPATFSPVVDAFLRGEWPAAAEDVTHAY